MRSLLLLCMAFLLLLPTEQVLGQNFAQNEVVIFHGKKFVMHQVRTGETVYSLSNKFGVAQSELEENNPGIEKGLTIGQVLKIPYTEGLELQSLSEDQKGDPSGFKKYKIESRKETAYSIAKKFGISVEDLYAYNPTVRKFKKRTVLNIPYWGKRGSIRNRRFS